MAGAAEDFDRSFEFFEKQQKAGTTREKDVSFCDEFGGGIALDTTFESNLFEFSVDECSLQDDHTENRSTIFSDDIFEQYQETTVQVAVHEQLSAMYDDFSQEGAITVTGSIHVKTPKVTPFTLVLRDEAHIVQRVEVFVASEVCELLQDGAVGGDRQLRVNLHESQSNEEILIAKYFCLPTLRPVPLVSSFSMYLCVL